ncbi:hypothetical protein ACP70R_049228 [Stipagrostis hirtigluma subsp. patula]
MAMKFVVDMLVDGDRLAMVPFSHEVQNPNEIELQEISAHRKNARDRVDNLQAGGGTLFTPALRKAVDILESRAVEETRKRRGFIIFLSDGECTDTDTDRKLWTTTLCKYQIDTFGFSKFHDPLSLLTIAEASRGTYSFLIQGLDRMREAFARCLGGLNSVVAINIVINLTAAPGLQITSIHSGGYKNQVLKGEISAGRIEIPVLYARETKNFIAHLCVPPINPGGGAGIEKQVLLNADGFFEDPTDTEKKVQVERGELHPGAVDGVNKLVVLQEMVRFKLLGVLKKFREEKLLGELKKMQGEKKPPTQKNFEEWAEWLLRMWEDEKKSCLGFDHADGIVKRFGDEVQEMVNYLKMQDLPGNARLAFVSSWESSHRMERATTMGSPGKVIPAYETPHIKAMVDEAQKPSGATVGPLHPETIIVLPQPPAPAAGPLVSPFTPDARHKSYEDANTIALSKTTTFAPPAADAAAPEGDVGKIDPCKCVDFDMIDKRLDLWSRFMREVPLQFQPSEDAESLHFTTVFRQASLEVINRAMHHDMYLAVVHASNLRRCYNAGKETSKAPPPPVPTKANEH